AADDHADLAGPRATAAHHGRGVRDPLDIPLVRRHVPVDHVVLEPGRLVVDVGHTQLSVRIGSGQFGQGVRPGVGVVGGDVIGQRERVGDRRVLPVRYRDHVQVGGVRGPDAVAGVLEGQARTGEPDPAYGLEVDVRRRLAPGHLLAGYGGAEGVGELVAGQ